MNRITTCITTVLLLLPLVPQGAPSQTVTVTPDSPTEALLASIDLESSRVPASTVRAYGRLLDRVDRKCPERRRMVSDMAVKGTQILAGEGVDASAWDMLTGLDEALKGEAASLGKQCSEVLAAVIALMIAEN